MSTANGFRGVADCYAFKSRLQEYAQKVNLPTPVYETEKEGLSHEPVFRSTVIVNGVRYKSLLGFYNRKAAEQSAAEVALFEIQKSGQNAELIPTLHETGLCKNLLQEYAQKMNYAIPSYICSRHTSENSSFTCSVEIGGIRYIGAAARTKKEAEIKAARTALLAIQSSSSGNEANVISQFTVLPGKKKGKEMEVRTESTKDMKPKKCSFKKKSCRKKLGRNKKGRSVFNDHPTENAHGESDRVVNSAEAGRMETDVLMQCSENDNSVVNLIEVDGDFVLNDCENTIGYPGLLTRTSSLDRSNLTDENIVKVDCSEKPRDWLEALISQSTHIDIKSHGPIRIPESCLVQLVPPLKEAKTAPFGENDDNFVIATPTEGGRCYTHTGLLPDTFT